MKKNLIFLLVGFLSVMCINTWSNRAEQSAMKTGLQPMLAAFESAQVSFSEGDVQGWSEINKEFSSLEDLKNYGDQVEKLFVGKNYFERKEISDQKFNSLEIKGSPEPGVRVEIVFQSLLEESKENATYLVANIIDARGPEKISFGRQKMLDIFSVFNKTPDINQLLIGSINGRLTKNNRNNKLNDIFHGAGGKVHGGVEDAIYSSKTGFIPGLPGYVEANGKKINLQAAASYNEIDQRTYIYIGSPLVYSDY